MAIVGKVRLSTVDAQERSSATREIPVELRGRRVMTRLVALVMELREQGTRPTAVHLTLDDESRLFESASETFGQPGAEATQAAGTAWRGFLVRWMREQVELDVGFDESVVA